MKGGMDSRSLRILQEYRRRLGACPPTGFDVAAFGGGVIRNNRFRVRPIFKLEEVVEGCDLVALIATKKTSGNVLAAPTGEHAIELTFNSRISTTSRRCRASRLRLGTSETASMILYWSASSTFTLQGKRREENK